MYLGWLTTSSMASFLKKAVRPFRIQYASNFFGKGSADLLKPGVAPNLALLGNCVNTADASFAPFLQFCSDNWENVFLVPGPYEMMSRKQEIYPRVLDTLHTKATKDYKNVYILDQSEGWTWGGLRILGFPGWAGDPDRPLTGKEMEGSIYSYGSSGVRPLTDPDLDRLNDEDTVWLSQQMNLQSFPTLILSHSLPTPHLLQRGLPHEAYRRMHLDIFPGELVRGFPNSVVKAWLGGATGSCSSGVFYNNYFMAVNSWKSHPGQAQGDKGYRPDAFYEYDWTRRGMERLPTLVPPTLKALLVPPKAVKPAMKTACLN